MGSKPICLKVVSFPLWCALPMAACSKGMHIFRSDSAIIVREAPMTILKTMSIFLLAGVTGCAANASNVPADRKSTRRTQVTTANRVCRILLDKKKEEHEQK